MIEPRFDEKLRRWRNGDPALFYRTVDGRKNLIGQVTVVGWDVLCDCGNPDCYYNAHYLFKVKDDRTGEIYERVHSNELDWWDIVY